MYRTARSEGLYLSIRDRYDRSNAELSILPCSRRVWMVRMSAVSTLESSIGHRALPCSATFSVSSVFETMREDEE